MNLSELGEGGAIARMAEILQPGGLPPGWIGIGDDSAVTDLDPGAGESLAGPPGATVEARRSKVLTTVDMLVEGVHFRTETTSAADLGWKALAVNVSDVFATGGHPLWAVVAIALRGDLPAAWLDDLYRGLREAAARFACPIVGGDTVGTPGPLALSVTVVGTAACPRLRSSARPGDILAVTGPIGLSAAGLWALGHRDAPLPPDLRERAQQAHRRPLPPGYSSELATRERMALMDDSDGLGTSARQIAVASGVQVVVDASRLDVADDVASVAAVAGRDPLEWRLWGGEDYGLIAAISPQEPLPSGFRSVGRIDTGQGAWLESSAGRTPLERGGFRHF